MIIESEFWATVIGVFCVIIMLIAAGTAATECAYNCTHDIKKVITRKNTVLSSLLTFVLWVALIVAHLNDGQMKLKVLLLVLAVLGTATTINEYMEYNKRKEL